MCKLKRSLYGLRISPKRWNERYTEAVVKLGLASSDLEPCSFVWREQNQFLILLLYVDDILMASNNKEKLKEVKMALSKEFQMTILGEPKEFLSISIRRDRENKTIRLSQEKFVDKILKRYGFEEVHPQRTSMLTIRAINHDRKMRESDIESENTEDKGEKINGPYREIVGSLLYLSGTTRQDISYTVNVLSRHQTNPTEEDWKMVTRLMRYLKGTKSLGLRYTGDKEGIESYSDASFADCKNSLTTCGYVIKLFGDSISWRTHKQTYVALSTCQAEYIAMSEASQEMLSIHNTLKLILIKLPLPMTLWCDNRAATVSAETNGGNKLRHIVEVKAHHIKECVKRKLIKVELVRSRDQLADVFTKPLTFELHKRQVDKIMNVNI